jgi:predicted nucleic acid-binding protein
LIGRCGSGSFSDLATLAEWATIMGVVHACRDPDDNKFLETAINGEADCIVTGDTDLLTLDPFHGMRVLTPRGFLEEVRGAGRK